MSIYGLFQSSSYWALCLLALCCLPAKGGQAAELSDFHGAVQIHGFLTQGYVKTTENSFFGDSMDGSFDFNELGINTSYRISPAMMASAQLLSRTAGEMYDGSLDVDFAQLDYAQPLDESSHIGFIIGRNKNPLGLYNDTRDVAATRPGIFMPQAIYWDRVRNMVLSNDGGQLYAVSQFGDHLFNLQLIVGKTPIDENVEKSYLNPGSSPKLDQDGVTTGGRLLYEWDGGRIRLALSNASLTMNGEMNLLPPGGVDLDYWVVSSQYNDGPWSLTMEYMEEPIDYTGFGGLMDVGDTTVDGYYLQGSYRMLPDWEMFARYEESHYDKQDKDGSKTSAKLGLPPHNFYSKLWTIGLLWEPTDHLMLRTEFSQVDGTIFLSNLENPLPGTKQREWNLFSLLVSYSF
jgi:hypothetical protein